MDANIAARFAELLDRPMDVTEYISHFVGLGFGSETHMKYYFPMEWRCHSVFSATEEQPMYFMFELPEYHTFPPSLPPELSIPVSLPVKDTMVPMKRNTKLVFLSGRDDAHMQKFVFDELSRVELLSGKQISGRARPGTVTFGVKENYHSRSEVIFVTSFVMDADDPEMGEFKIEISCQLKSHHERPLHTYSFLITQLEKAHADFVSKLNCQGCYIIKEHDLTWFMNYDETIAAKNKKDAAARLVEPGIRPRPKFTFSRTSFLHDFADMRNAAAVDPMGF